jgi:endoglucanase
MTTITNVQNTSLNPIVKLFILIFLFSLLTTCNSLKAQSKFGITLCGAEFGNHNLPGILNKDYTYPLPSDIAYYKQKGVELIQLPFRWERIQTTLGGPLNQLELSMLSQFIDNCRDNRIRVILIMQNYGRYKINGVEHIVGSPYVSLENYKDVWRKIATAFNYKINIHAYGIMAEPNNMQGYSWFNAAQYAIDGIRDADRHSNILVDGENYSNPFTWAYYNDNLKYLRDPLDKIYFNAHCYFDADFSGKYQLSYEANGANEYTGVSRVKPFVDWLKTNRKKGFVGEFGVPKNDTRWLSVLDNFLYYLQANGIGGCYWAAGRWWKDYPLSIEPKHGKDQPQLLVYQKYFSTNPINGYASNTTTQTYVSAAPSSTR